MVRKRFFKRNFVKALEYIIPELYRIEDYEVSGMKLDAMSEMVNHQLNILNGLSSLGFVPSATPNFSAINTASGLAPYFVKQNEFTKVTPYQFEKKILKPLGKSLTDFETSSAFITYLSGTLLSSIQLNDWDLDTNTSSVFASAGGASATHEYLIRELSWFYFLNTSGNSTLPFSPSSTVASALQKVYLGKTLYLSDAMEALTEYCWRNYHASAIFSGTNVFPANFVSGVTTSGTYVSGNQQLDKLKTLISILYSPNFMDENDKFLKDSITNFLSLGTKLSQEELAGAFHQFLKAIGYSISDVQNDVDRLSVLYDLNDVPEEYLPLIAELIGWHLFGIDSSRWRVQLLNAVNVYKSVGTKKAIQYVSNSLFSKDIVDVSSNIQEMWESYIPHLIYYALATESPFFNSMQVYTTSTVNLLEIDTYSASSLDKNIRLNVDDILYTLVKKFPWAFPLGGAGFPVDSPDFQFKYRDRIIGVPPFEEYKYYKDASITPQILETIWEILVCKYLVPQWFATALIDYVRDYTLQSTNDLFLGNAWLFLTSGNISSPNQPNILSSVGTVQGDRKLPYLSLWNGKSSHVIIAYNATDFNFLSDDLTVSSGQALYQGAKILKEYLPAHAVPDTLVITSGLDDYWTLDTSAMEIMFSLPDFLDVSSGGGPGMRRYGLSGINMSGAPTDLSGGVRSFKREDADDFFDNRVSATSAIITAPRSALRRRNLKYLLTNAGIYDRGGFNMPLTFAASTTENSIVSSIGFLPLGYRFSGAGYQNATDVNNLHDVWGICEDLDSSNTYFQVDTSNTFPCRGLSSLGSNKKYGPSAVDMYNTRGSLPAITVAMHEIIEASKLKQGELLSTDSQTGFPVATYAASSSWMNVAQSIANASSTSTDFSVWWDTALGRELHDLYLDFASVMNRTAPINLEEKRGGFDIFSHAYGPLVYNGWFDRNGTIAKLPIPGKDAGLTFVISSLECSATQFYANSISPYSVLNNAGIATWDTFETLNIGHLPLTDQICANSTEYRNAKILSGIEFCMPKDTGPGYVASFNSFWVYRLANTAANASELGDDYLIDNTVIKMKALNHFPRLRFDLSSYPGSNFPDAYGGGAPNRFLPENHFEATITAHGGAEEGPKLGDVAFGVNIHTKVEDLGGGVSSTWYWVPETEGEAQGMHMKRGTWVLETGVSGLRKDDVINNYSIIFNIAEEEADENLCAFISDYYFSACAELKDAHNPKALLKHTKENFKKFIVPFNTTNHHLPIPTVYHERYGLVHRSDQQYFMEIFMVPSPQNYSKYVLLDSVDIKDITLADRARVKFDTWLNIGQSSPRMLPYSPFSVELGQQYIDIPPHTLHKIFYYFNKLADGKASRNATATAGSFETNGGSKLNYREHPTWEAFVSGTPKIGGPAGAKLRLTPFSQYSSLEFID